MTIKALTLLLGMAALSGSTPVQAKCLTNLNQLKAAHVNSRWEETTENDGKPLRIVIADGGQGLIYSAKKAGVVWLTGNVSVCPSGAAVAVTLSNSKATNNVPVFARMGMPSTQSAQIVNNQMILSGGGWGGTFVGR